MEKSPSKLLKSKTQKEHTQEIKSTSWRHSNYISLIKSDATSQQSYEDTAGTSTVHEIRTGFFHVEAKNADLISCPKLESYKAFQVGQHNDSALQHWLTDTQHATRATTLQSDQTAHNENYNRQHGYPTPELAPGSNAARKTMYFLGRPILCISSGVLSYAFSLAS